MESAGFSALQGLWAALMLEGDIALDIALPRWALGWPSPLCTQEAASLSARLTTSQNFRAQLV